MVRFRYIQFRAMMTTAGSLGIIFCGAIIVAIIYAQKQRKQNEAKHLVDLSPMIPLHVNPLSEKYMFNVHSDLFMAIFGVTGIQPDWLITSNVAEIRYEDTRIKGQLGEGQFGVVSTGIIQLENGIMIDVAMKTTKYDEDNEYCQKMEIALLREAEIMARVRGHDHVIYLQGIMVNPENNRFHLVMGLCTNQSLKDFLDANWEYMRDEEDDKKKLQWAAQIADAMAYLQGKGVVHMDLATRNVLLTHPDELAKVSDFGLSRFINDVEERPSAMENKERKRPMRHSSTISTNLSSLMSTDFKLPLYMLPPEIWTDNFRATFATDAWSFGILLWEMFTAGRSAAKWMSDMYMQESSLLTFGEFIMQWVQNGGRLPSPWPAFRPTTTAHGKEVFENMSKCWSERPEDRPSFESLEKALKALIPGQDLALMNTAVTNERMAYQQQMVLLEGREVQGP